MHRAMQYQHGTRQYMDVVGHSAPIIGAPTVSNSQYLTRGGIIWGVYGESNGDVGGV